MKKYSLKIVKKEMLTEDIMMMHLERPAELEYKAGQFVQFIVPHGEKIAKRSYSVCSVASDGHLEFCIKILPEEMNGAASLHLPTLALGDEIEIFGPLGRFVVEDQKRNYFIATGTGIAPIMGMLREELENKQNIGFQKLILGVREQKDLFWVDRLERLANEYENFSYLVTLSRPKENMPWNGLVGRVTDYVKDEDISVFDKFYICGNGEMVKDMRTILIEKGVDAKNIHFEIF